MSAPHERTDVVPLRRGGLWIEGESVAGAAGTVQRGSAWVEWLAPEAPTHRTPLVLIHGGGGQGTDWLVTPDGRPGWAAVFAAEGRPVYVLDRPGHGRSPHHPDVLGAPGPQGGVEMVLGVFAPPGAEAAQTQWPWPRTTNGREVGQLVASSGSLLADLGSSQELDAARVIGLLEKTGPAVLVTHSAGAPAGWLAASHRPDLVRAIVAVEPMGPPFLDAPGLGALSEGLTAVPLGSESLDALEIVILTGEASPFAAAAPATADFLGGLGAAAFHLPLGARGITGNGHGLIFEQNSDDTARLVLEWLDERDAS